MAVGGEGGGGKKGVKGEGAVKRVGAGGGEK